MISRADKIIEGFKLGSLGAGLKTPIRNNEPQEKASVSIDIIKEGTNKHVDSGVSCPYFFWKEEDGWSYCLFVGLVEHVYTVFVYGGEELKPKVVDTEGSIEKGWIIAVGMEWMIYSLNMKFGSIAFQRYNDALSFIKRYGSRFLTMPEGIRIFSKRTGYTFKLWAQSHGA